MSLFHQHKKDLDKAIASFRTVTTKYPDFVLADAAQLGIAECLLAQGKLKEASACLEKQRPNYPRLEGSAILTVSRRLSARLNGVQVGTPRN